MSSTKEKILEISLDMFSKQGYTAVSIRDICSQVGIKESSVYYHFKNKQAIFDELLNRFSIIANEMMLRLENGLTDESNPFYDGINTVSDCLFEHYLMDDFCNKVMRVMLIEQLGNDDVRELYQDAGYATAISKQNLFCFNEFWYDSQWRQRLLRRKILCSYLFLCAEMVIQRRIDRGK